MRTQKEPTAQVTCAVGPMLSLSVPNPYAGWPICRSQRTWDATPDQNPLWAL